MATFRPSARSYRDFLTPALHRRFTNAALVTSGICYVEACWMGEWDLFWQWFPLGTSGIRTLLLFLPALAVYILRVAQLHIGSRTTLSDIDNFKTSLISFRLMQTLAWYGFSAWFFGEVYISATAEDANLSVIDVGEPYEPEHLNERPIYLRTMFLLIAVLQTLIHLYNDYDRVTLPFDKTRKESPEQPTFQGIIPTLMKLKEALPRILQASLFRMVFVSLAGPFVYFLFLRQTAWHWTYNALKYFRNLPTATGPMMLPPHLADLFGRLFIEGFLLIFLWEFCNEAFSSFVAQEPLKKGHLLTEDSKDPNGSLLAGLKAKKEVPRIMAFWELVLIAYYYPKRRSTIYQELDRKGGSTFSQVFTVCLGELHALVKRIQDFQNPPPKVTPPSSTKESIHTLPRISQQPVKEGTVFTAPPPPRSGYEKFQSEMGNFAKSYGQSPGADPISPKAMKLLTYGADAALSKDQQKLLSQGSISTQVHGYLATFLRSPLGPYFQVSFGRYMTRIVLGTPNGSLGTTLDAITAITRLAIHGKIDDMYGKVYQDVPSIIRTFVSTIAVIEKFISTAAPHWTDIDFKQDKDGSRSVPDVELVLASLRNGLRDLINEYGEYADDMGLTRAELRQAKETVAAGLKKY